MTNNSSKSVASSDSAMKTRSKGMMFPKLVIEKKVNVVDVTSILLQMLPCMNWLRYNDKCSASLLDSMNPNRITAHTEIHSNSIAWKFESSVNRSMCSNKSIKKFDWFRIEQSNRVSFIHISVTTLRVNIYVFFTLSITGFWKTIDIFFKSRFSWFSTCFDWWTFTVYRKFLHVNSMRKY